VFGRACFIADVSWQKRDGPPNDRTIGSIHDHVLVWGKALAGTSKKTLAEEAFNLMPRTEKADAQYQVFREPDGPDPRGPFRKIDTTANAKGGRYVASLYYALKNPNTGEEVWPRKGTCWRHNPDEMARLQADRRLYVRGVEELIHRVRGQPACRAVKILVGGSPFLVAPDLWERVGADGTATNAQDAIVLAGGLAA